MALYVTISINDDVLQTYGASRLGEKETGVNEYRVCKYVDGQRVYLKGKLLHNYEDGANVMAQKLLTFVAEDEANKHGH